MLKNMIYLWILASLVMKHYKQYLPHHVLAWICLSPPLVALLSVACLLYVHAYTSDHVYNHSMYILLCVCTRVDIQEMCTEECSNLLYYK